MGEVVINDVKFKNVPDKHYGTKIGDLLTQSNIGMSQAVSDYIHSDNFYALVNGIDIDWNGIEIEQGLVLNTTADLINWIKTKGSGGGEQVQSDWNETNVQSKAYIKNKPTIPDGNIQSDWNQIDPTTPDFIKNKPDIPEGVVVDSQFSDASTNPVQNKVIKKAFDNKVDKVTGKGLSTNDYTNEDKSKVAAALTQHQDISGKADKTSLQAEVARATTAEETLRQLYNNLQQSQPIPVTQLPATGEASKIYRLAGTTSYADYMYSENDLNTPIKMAEYNNAIDDEPIAGSDNLLSSNAVYNAVMKVISKCRVSDVYNVHDCKNQGLIKYDGTVNPTVDGGLTSDRIFLDDVIKVQYFDIWENGETSFSPLTFYNSNDEVVGRYTGYGEVVVSELPNAKYLRFSRYPSNPNWDEIGYSACVLLFKRNSFSDGLKNCVNELYKLFSSDTIRINGVNAANGYALVCNGAPIEIDNFYTSELIEVDMTTVISIERSFARASKWAGICLYDYDGNLVTTLGGTQTINVIDFGNIRYFRYCVAPEDFSSFTLSYTKLSNDRGYNIKSQDLDILNNGRATFNKYDCSAGKIINYDGTVKDFSSSDWGCSELIPVGIAKYLMHIGVWDRGETTFCGLCVYNSNKEVIWRNSKTYDIVDLSELADAAYFRFLFCSDNFNVRNPVVVLSYNIISGNIYDDVACYIKAQSRLALSVALPNYKTWGYNYPSKSDIKIKHVEISYDTSSSAIGDLFDVYIGSIDQRGWFIERISSKLILSKQDTALNINYYLPTEDISVLKGEIVIVRCGDAVCFHVDDTTPEYGEMIHTDNGNTSVVFRDDHVTLNRFVISGDYTSDISDFNTLTETMKQIEEQVEEQSVCVDKVTGKPYEIIVTNGVLSAKEISYANILVIGNSFSSHPYKDNVWWAEGRGMAASVDETQYTRYIKDTIGADMDVIQYAGYFETHYSPTYDFENTLPITKDYDLVIVQLGENSTYSNTMEASWEALFNYLKTKLPNAFIIQIIGYYVENKYNAIKNACQNKGIILINCSSETRMGNYSLGCYVTGSDGTYHEITVSGVVSHPSDVGMYMIAKTILKKLKFSLDGKMHSLTLVQKDGGLIYAPYKEWPKGGIVNIKAVPNNGKNINSLEVISENQAISSVKRENSNGIFFTFVMPNASVVITPNWK